MNNIQQMIGLHKYNHIYIYGAGVVAYGIYAYLKEIENIKIDAFVVTTMNDEKTIDGVNVMELRNVEVSADIFWIIATPEVYHDEIRNTLESRGFTDYICVDYLLEYSLMGEYLHKKNNIVLMENIQPEYTYDSLEDDCCRILMAVSHKDKELSSDCGKLKWVKKIQVGAALTDKRITELTDCEGINISEQNALYGELTATYYAWKNMKYPIVGLFHYRRILEIEDWMLCEIKKDNVDVILPLPFVCYPDTKGQYGRYLLDEDIEIMWEVLEHMAPDYVGEARKVLSDTYLYNYNMLIARWDVFEDYCNWLFPVLQEICERCEQTERNRLPRYIGRIGEVLTSIYFLVNKDNWKIGHARKRWLV